MSHSPFEWLHNSFPFTRPDPLALLGVGAGFGAGRGSGVSVLEVAKVGSFTAFVLQASESQALTSWLQTNGFVTTPENDAWLGHYVQLKFHFVALRYDGVDEVTTQRAPGTLKSETIRLSFATPIPYYPYFEPTHENEKSVQQQAPIPARLLELWFVAPQPMTPVALYTQNGSSRWVRPMREGSGSKNVYDFLTSGLEDSLDMILPLQTLTLQTFQDQKRSREGYGDILFVPSVPTPLGELERKQLEAFIGILDPSLMPQGEVK